MPNPNAVVSTVVRLEPPLDRSPEELLRAEGGLSVELEEGRRVRLDPDDRRSAGFARVLDGLSKQGLPVYIELDPETSSIARLFIPYIARVVDIRPIDDETLSVEIAPSHARHVLRRAAPDFEELERQLRDAMASGEPVILTEDDAHEILDVRTYRPEAEPLLPFPRPTPPPKAPPWARFLLRIWWWPWWPWWWWRWWFRCISATKAQQVFAAMNATSCDPLTVPPPCIPFLYPDDGCWGRAHEMRRLMVNMGLNPKKVWIQGSLHVSTKNNPTCNVYWGWHVAPWLCVRGRFPQTQAMVIDPSLFTTPVSKATWKGVQGDPNATLTDSDGSIFYLWGNVTDPNYVQTNQVLATYRLKLQTRSIQQGPPPYAYCP
jgi:Glutaminase